jgi:hypothetical protein
MKQKPLIRLLSFQSDILKSKIETPVMEKNHGDINLHSL